MTRIFERRKKSLHSIERYIIDGNILTVQYVHDETTAEAEKRLGRKLCGKILEETGGEIKGHVWKEWSENILDIGWSSVNKFIKERMDAYTEIK